MTELFPRCTETLRAKGVAYPRTCQECGLGPCRKNQPKPTPVVTDLDTALQRIDFDCPSAALVIREHLEALVTEIALIQAALNESIDKGISQTRAEQAERERDALREALLAILHTYDDGGVPLSKAFQMANAAIAGARAND